MLPREEVALLLASLTACGFLVLGVLEILWPAAPARAPRRPQPRAPRGRRRAPAAPGEGLSAGRLLLARAAAEPDPDRQLAHLQAAVACLARAARAAPEADDVRSALDEARRALWSLYERRALARVAAAMPWGATALARRDG